MTATAQTSVEAGIGVTFVSSLMASGSVTNANITTVDNVAASLSGAATVTGATLDVIQPTFSADYLIVAGGGAGGGTTNGGGGGAGGYRKFTSQTLSKTSYTVTVGGGGTGTANAGGGSRSQDLTLLANC